MDSHVPHAHMNGAALRRAVRLVALLNLGYFGVEIAVALAIGSVSLFADSIDFLEDAAINGLILIALGWSAQRRSMVVYLYPAGNAVASTSGTIPPFHHLCEGALPWYPTSFSTS